MLKLVLLLKVAGSFTLSPKPPPLVFVKCLELSGIYILYKYIIHIGHSVACVKSYWLVREFVREFDRPLWIGKFICGIKNLDLESIS